MGGCFSNSSSGTGRQVRVLVLGTAGCGKSTFAKQLKILYTDGFNAEERSNFKNFLIQNLLLGAKTLAAIAEESGSELLTDKKLTKTAKFFKDLNPYATPLDQNLVDKIHLLWDNQPIQDAFLSTARKCEFTESLRYAIANLDRISKDDWQPTNDDVLHIRQRTTGIVETHFQVEKYQWTLIDVGGQKVERRKWIHSQQNLTAVIFFAALDEYDVQNEEAGKFGIDESLDVWADTINTETFSSGLPIFLFLNKSDIFEDKIKHVPLKKTWKKYKGGADFDAAVEWIRDLYLDRLVDMEPERIKVHVTCAVQTDSIKIVFEEVTNWVFQERLHLSGL